MQIKKENKGLMFDQAGGDIFQCDGAEEKLQSGSRQEFDWPPLTVPVSSSTFNEWLKTLKSLMDLAPPPLAKPRRRKRGGDVRSHDCVSVNLHVRDRGKCFSMFLSPAFKIEETHLFMHLPLIHLPFGS